YDNATAVLRVANPSAESALYFGGEMSIHLNYHGSNDNGSLGIMNSVAIPKSEENAPAWCDFALRGLDIKEGTNTLTFSILGEDVPYIDYVDFHIGSEFSNSNVSLAAAGEKVVRDFEDLSFEKAVTRSDYMETYNLSTGEICILPNAQANGGNAVYALMNGEATTLITSEEDSTVQIIINAASHIDWRFIRDAEIKLDGEVITFNEHNIRAGTETEVVWKDTSLGFFDLTAGEHLLDIKINSPHAKFDSVTFKTVSKGEFTEIHPDVYLDEVGTQIMEGEHLDASNVVVRQDYSELVIGATHGKYNTRTEKTASGWKYIDGFTGFPDASKNPYNPGTVEKTTFTVDFYLAADATVEVNAVACSTLGVNLAKSDQVFVKIDGEKCAPAPCNLAQYHKSNGEYNDPRWVDTLIAKKNLEAGMHTFTIDVLNFFFDLDCFKFKAVTMGDYVPDTDIILDGMTEQKFEAESITRGEIVLQNGVSPTDGYKFHVYTGSGSSSNLYIGGFAQGNELEVKFNLEKATNYKILISVKAGLPIAIWKYDGHPAGDSPHCDFYMDKGANNETHFMPPDAANGNKVMSANWQELIISTNISLESGSHTLTILMSKYAFDIDYIKFVPVAGEPVHNHQWGNWTVTKEPTATEEGKATRVCNGGGTCNAAISEKECTLPVLTSGAYTKTADTATCSAGGSVTYTYNKDGVNVSFAVATSAKGHSWGDWAVTDENKPTATETGKATHTCSNANCDATVTEKEYTLPVLTSGDYTKTADTATCSAAGSVTYTYNKDGVSVSFNVATAINPEAHDYGEWQTDRADGHYKVCSHNPEHIIGPEAHDTDGERGTCSVCGYNPGHSHAWSDWTVTDENKPSATATGKATRTCSNDYCDATEAQKEYALPVLTSEDYTKTTDTATCSAGGSVTYTYNKDGVNVSFTVATPAKGHNWGDWTVTKAPTETEEGKATRSCSNDGCDATTAEKEYVLPVLTSEDYSKGADSATCNCAGEMTYSYDKDGVSVSFTVATPAKGHDWSDWAVIDENKPTDTETGKATHICSNADCDATEEEKEYVLPVLTSEEYTKSNDTATCSAVGTATYTYAIDGENVSFEAASPVNPEAHDYGDYKQTDGGHFRVCRLNSAHKESVSAHNTDGENGACSACGFREIDGVGTYYIEAEKFDPAGFKAAQDFLNAGSIKSATDEYCVRADEGAHGGNYICGFAVGTRVDDTTTYTGGAYATGYFGLKEAATVKVSVIARASLGVAFKRPYEFGFKIDDTQETPAGFLQPNSNLGALQTTWGEFVIADAVRLEAGVHSIKAIAGQYAIDLDCIVLTIIGYGKNEGGKINDINLTGTEEQKFEAEWIDDGSIVLQSGTSATQGYNFPVYSGSSSSNDLYIGGFGQGNELYVNFNLEQATTYKILISVKSTNGILVGKYEGNPREPSAAHCDFYVDETHLEPYSWSSNPAMNGNNNGQGFVTNDLTIKEGGSSGISLEAGNHTFRIKMTTYAFDIDYITFVPVSAE
ncbi:MAG TPA: hypothetical protein DD415_02540, partial [Clostridiales bacterium]|nr:hypothetical protein [Clostridiales bacterium]